MKRFILLAVLVAAGSAAAHDLWLVPDRFILTLAAPVTLRANTGMIFPESESAIRPERVARWAVFGSRGARWLTEFARDGPALTASWTPPRPGTYLAVLDLHPRFIELGPEEFLSYLEEEGLQQIIALREEVGVSDLPGRERYTKFAKAILQVGERTDETAMKVVGQLLEIVPRANPYELEVGEELTCQILFRGVSLAGAQVAAVPAGVRVDQPPLVGQTDAAGRVTFTLDRPGPWTVRMVHMIPAVGSVPGTHGRSEPDERMAGSRGAWHRWGGGQELSTLPEPPGNHISQDADWESFFATLTFALPG